MDAVTALLALGAVLLVGGLAAGAVLIAVALLVARRLVIAGQEAAGRLTVRAHALRPGAVGELARLRRDLQRALDGVARDVHLAGAAGWPLGDAPHLAARLQVSGAGLDHQLAAAARRDPGACGREVAVLSPQVRAVAGAADELAAGLRASGRALDATAHDETLRLARLEAAALRGR